MDDLGFFESKGYYLAKGLLKQSYIDLKKECERIEQISRKGYWPYTKVYNDFPYINGDVNIFGADYPLNQKLDSKIFNLLDQEKIKKKVLHLSGWSNLRTSLIRLHSFNKYFNYQGVWHRDDDSFPSPNSVQSIVYLKDESGFCLVTKEKNSKLIDFDFPLQGQPENIAQLQADLPTTMYDQIFCEAGDVLFFEAGLLHRGFCKNERLHLHIRHERINSSINDNSNTLNFDQQFLPNYDLAQNKDYVFFKKDNSILSKMKRAVRFLKYFFPRFGSVFRNIFINKKVKETIFHSTIYQ